MDIEDTSSTSEKTKVLKDYLSLYRGKIYLNMQWEGIEKGGSRN